MSKMAWKQRIALLVILSMILPLFSPMMLWAEKDLTEINRKASTETVTEAVYQEVDEKKDIEKEGIIENKEVGILYQDDDMVNFTLNGEGLFSEPEPSYGYIGREVTVYVSPPEGKYIDQFLVNEEDKTEALENLGPFYQCIISIQTDTEIKVLYKSVDSDSQELVIHADTADLMIGEARSIALEYRGEAVEPPFDGFWWEIDDESIASFDRNTGEITALKSGTFILTAMLRGDRERKDQIEIEVLPPFVSTIRIEGNDHTIVSEREVEITSLDLTEYNISREFDEVRPIHVIIAGLESVGIDCTDSQNGINHNNGTYIDMINGLATFSTGPGDGWMYYVDHQWANLGVDNYRIDPNQQIVMFFVEDYMDNTYSWFEEKRIHTSTGEATELVLTGSHYNMWTDETTTGPVEGAKILWDEEVLAIDGETFITDEDGKVSIIFDKPGTYHLSAERFSTEGKRDISRPYVKVVVEGDEKEPTPFEVELKGLTNPSYQSKVTAKVEYRGDFQKPVSIQLEYDGQIIEAEASGEYVLNLAEGINVIRVTATDATGKEVSDRKVISYSQIKVVDFKPAPGQFTNTNWTDASRLRSVPDAGISLGAFGGYVIVEFEEPVKNDPRNPYGMDFTVFGNPFEIAGQPNIYNQEPGIVEVSNSLEGPWYVLAGSEHYQEDTYHDYRVTYTNPKKEEATNVPWQDNKGNQGHVKRTIYNNPMYPDAEAFPNINQDQYTLTGVSILNDLAGTEVGTRAYQVGFGYADSTPTASGADFQGPPNNPYRLGIQGYGGDAMDLRWAVDQQGNPVKVDEIRYVKVYTGVMKHAGSFGEISTEITGIRPSTPVENKVHRIEIAGDLEIEPGQTSQLYVKAFDQAGKETIHQQIDWSIEDSKAADIRKEAGLVTGLQDGKVQITATLATDPTVQDTVEMVVGSPETVIPKSLHITNPTGNNTLQVGGKTRLTPVVYDETGHIIEGIEDDAFAWESQEESIASVKPCPVFAGRWEVEGHRVGYTTIQAVYEGIEGSAIIRVVEEELNVRTDDNRRIAENAWKNALENAKTLQSEKVYLGVINTKRDREGEILRIPVAFLQQAKEQKITLVVEAKDYGLVIDPKAFDLSPYEADSAELRIKTSMLEAESIPAYQGKETLGRTWKLEMSFHDGEQMLEEISQFPAGMEIQWRMKYWGHEGAAQEADRMHPYILEDNQEAYIGHSEYHAESQQLRFSLKKPALVTTVLGDYEPEEEPVEEEPEEELEPGSLEEAARQLVRYYQSQQPNSPTSDWEAFVGLWGLGENFRQSPWPVYGWQEKDPGFDAITFGNAHIHHIYSLLGTGHNPAEAFETNRNLFSELAQQQNADSGYFGNLGKHIWAMVALDIGLDIDAEIPEWNAAARQKAIDALLAQQNADGSFGRFSHIDYTGWALIPLSRSEGVAVEKAIQDAKSYLKSMQEPDGGFGGTGMWDVANSNSIACVIQGLTALGIDIQDPEGPWAKNGNTPVDALLKYQREDGSFNWKMDDEGSIGMATKQVSVAISDLQEGSSTWYRMGTISFETVDDSGLIALIEEAEEKEAGQYTAVSWQRMNQALEEAKELVKNQSATQEAVDQAAGKLREALHLLVRRVTLSQEEGSHRITLEDMEEEVEIEISPADSHKEVEILLSSTKPARMNLPADTPLPGIRAENGKSVFELEKGTQITEGDSSRFDLLIERPEKENEIESLLKNHLSSNGSPSSIKTVGKALSLGNEERITLDQYATLTFKGESGKEAGYLQNGTLSLVEKVSNIEEAEKQGMEIFAYDNGENLLIRTTHFTDFFVYSLEEDQEEDQEDEEDTGSDTGSDTGGGGAGGGGGVAPKPEKQTVTISIDKKTIGKGYVLRPVEVELKEGDSAWDVLKREMDRRSIAYRYSFSDQYNSVYVESIAGDGEFDHGEFSGWMYNVNGWYPNYGASRYELRHGDRMQWRYTTNLGEDLGEDLSKWENDGDGGHTVEIKAGEKKPVLQIPEDIKEKYVIKIDEKLKDIEVLRIEIPETEEVVALNLAESKDALPAMIAVKEDWKLEIEKDTALLSEETEVQLFSSVEKEAIEWLEKQWIDSDTEEEKVVKKAVMMGHPEKKISFSIPVTLSLKNGGNLQVVVKSEEALREIPVYETEEKAKEAAAEEKEAYAYLEGDTLRVKTLHFSDFFFYQRAEEVEEVEKIDEAAVAEKQRQERLEALRQYEDEAQISDWAREAMAKAVDAGVMRGYSQQLRPQDAVTRAEFVTLLTTVVETADQQRSLHFHDVAPDHWYYQPVMKAAGSGWVSGYGDSFNPQAPISREEMAVMLAKAIELEYWNSIVDTSDAELVSPWAAESVSAVMAHRYINGNGNQFMPKEITTREMAAVVVMKVFDGEAEKEQKNISAASDLADPVEEEEAKEDEKVQKEEKKEGKEKEASEETTIGRREAVLQKKIEETASFMKTMVPDPQVASVGGEWTVFSIARSHVEVPKAYQEKYLKNVENTMREKEGVLHHIKYTEYDRVILALTSLGVSVEDVAGYSLLDPLADFETVLKQGLNGPIWALIALDTGAYEIPQNPDFPTQTSREKLIQEILDRELPGGGWSLTGDLPGDTDITGMAIQALAPYQDQPAVKAATEKGLDFLSQEQLEDGSFQSAWGNEASSESISQVIVALTALGIHPEKDSRFIKNGNSPVDALLSFYVEGGGFRHIQSGEVDPMATDQGMYALVSYHRFLKGLPRLYDMTAVVSE
ncbi:Prenyltransferase and squalene oxidase repeat-containing protein [Tindallia magadiensis]|uniref:Prenyltransferase and squalene oxidase repeat-containing protein n=1 Tax=Tindallia magadiensis TaxID=69895 RepID=A0A1I3D7M4_9FIRM|nr:DUF4430 domain-containing protein [Tindallia magadiensis]SFH82676.1 Prenyltransferase and squalene oxidase repeat-containing protein [Tindallia magadiensis]